jgi:hypothetical protein
MNRGSSDNRDRSEVESSASSYSPHLAWTKLDNFAVFKLGRIHSLPALALLLLFALCMIADRRTGFVKSTVHALHEDSRIGRGTVPKMLAALESAGIVKIVRPFGPNVEGELEIVAWSDIVIETPREKTLRLTNLEKRQTAAQPRPNRGPTADRSANDQGKRPNRGDEGGEEDRDSWQEEGLVGEDWDSRQEEVLSGEDWDSRQEDWASEWTFVSRVDVAILDSEAVQVSPNPRCADCGGWLEPPLPEGEDWCMCDANAWWKQR